MNIQSAFANYWQNTLNDYERALFNYAGFYKFNYPIWSTFLPYVFMFFYAILVVPIFRNKLEKEKMDLTDSEVKSDLGLLE